MKIFSTDGATFFVQARANMQYLPNPPAGMTEQDFARFETEPFCMVSTSHIMDLRVNTELVRTCRSVVVDPTLLVCTILSTSRTPSNSSVLERIFSSYYIHIRACSDHKDELCVTIDGASVTSPGPCLQLQKRSLPGLDNVLEILPLIGASLSFYFPRLGHQSGTYRGGP